MSIVSSALKIYSDSGLQHLVTTIAGTTALSQTLNVTGLSSNTAYWAQAEATDDHNQTGYSTAQMFTTAATSYVFTNDSVEYENDFDTLFAAVDVAGPAGTTFTECGVQFCLNSNFSGQILSGVNTAGAANFFSGDVSGFNENTTYYYRFYATSTQYGTQTYTPQNNTITTLYDEPTLTITASSVANTTADVTFSYVGNYPVDTATYSNMNAFWMVNGAQPSSATTVQFGLLDNNVPETIHLSGLQPNTTYYVEWNVTLDPGETWEREITAYTTFTTLPSIPTVTISTINNITPSSADISITIS